MKHLSANRLSVSVLLLLLLCCGTIEKPRVTETTDDKLLVLVKAGELQPLKDLLKERHDASPASLSKTLLLAVETNQAAMVQTLLGAGADSRTKDRQGHSVLFLAISQNRNEVAKALLNSNASAKEEPLLILAIKAGMDELLPALLQHGGDPNEADNMGYTVLMHAVTRSRLADMQVLLEHGADLVAQDLYGNTALIHSVFTDPPLNEPIQFCNPEVVRTLTEAGADVYACDGEGIPVLCLAVMQNCPEVVSMLVHAGADMAQTDRYGRDARGLATVRNLPEILDIFEHTKPVWPLDTSSFNIWAERQTIKIQGYEKRINYLQNILSTTSLLASSVSRITLQIDYLQRAQKETETQLQSWERLIRNRYEEVRNLAIYFDEKSESLERLQIEARLREIQNQEMYGGLDAYEDEEHALNRARYAAGDKFRLTKELQAARFEVDRLKLALERAPAEWRRCRNTKSAAGSAVQTNQQRS